MSWRNARSIVQLRREVDAAYPNRNKRSDGTIGDANHRNRNSDHNPWVPPPNGGVVTAIDITHDPANGLDSRVLAEHLRQLGARGDRRVKYVISHHRIASSRENWRWRPYNGSNPHTSHMHLSVSSTYYDDTNSWGIQGSTGEDDYVLKRGSKGNAVRAFQTALQEEAVAANRSDPLPNFGADGDFGAETENAVRRYQRAANVDQTGEINGITAALLARYITVK